ncbi:MAG: FHIPEP family type III secretion protein, partial [Spirochaetota bacterium]
MADISGTLRGSLLNGRNDIMVAVGVIAVIAMMIIPLPAFMLDLLMASNLVFSLLVILIVLYTRRALEFSVFPTLLLLS